MRNEASRVLHHAGWYLLLYSIDNPAFRRDYGEAVDICFNLARNVAQEKKSDA